MPKKILLKRKEGLYLRDTGHKGRGVFCTQAIRAGEVLEVTPSVILNERQTRHLNHTLLIDYIFMIGRFSKRLLERMRIKKTDDASAVIMGVATFCNDGEKPNAEILWEEQDGTIYYSLRATRAIPRNTEICTSYGAGWFDNRKP